jgi:predicted transport protein
MRHPKATAEALGDDVQVEALKQYIAFKKLRNFACVEAHPQSGNLLVFLKVDPDSIDFDDGFSRDVRKIGHFGTGDLELRISSQKHLEDTKPLLAKSYEAS